LVGHPVVPHGSGHYGLGHHEPGHYKPGYYGPGHLHEIDFDFGRVLVHVVPFFVFLEALGGVLERCRSCEVI